MHIELFACVLLRAVLVLVVVRLEGWLEGKVNSRGRLVLGLEFDRCHVQLL